MGKTLAYAASLVPEIADTPAEVDEAMRLGYAWGRGPFELIDAVGPAWFAEQLAKRGEKVPPILAQAAQAGSFYRIADAKREILAPAIGYLPLHRAAGVLSLDDLKLAAKPVAGNSAASIWDLGDGVACLEFHTKMNAFDSDLVTGVEIALDETAKNFQALVIGNEGAGLFRRRQSETDAGRGGARRFRLHRSFLHSRAAGVPAAEIRRSSERRRRRRHGSRRRLRNRAALLGDPGPR